MRWLLVLTLIIVACDPTTVVDSAPGPPDHRLPLPTTAEIVVDGATVTDTRPMVGECLRTHLWAETDDRPDWVLVAVNDIKLETVAHEVLCEPILTRGPFSTHVLGRLPDGWYTVCDAISVCTEPFEKT